MKRTKICVTLSILLAVAMLSLGAAATAEKQYAEIQGGGLSIEEAKTAWDRLDESILRERATAEKQLQDAWKRGDVSLFRDARQRLNVLASYRMTPAQSDELLTQILTYDEPQRGEYAAWLATRSPYYRPTLTLDFSAAGDRYRYSYRQQITRQAGSIVRLPDARQIRFNPHQLGVLLGWGLTPDAVTYAAGETISLPYTDQTLFAIYGEGVRFVDARSETDVVFESQVLTAPTPDSDDPSALFAGWYDRSTGMRLAAGEEYQRSGKGGLFEALWKQLSIEDLTLLYWERDSVPTQTQMGLGFAYTNGGTLALRGLKATLSSESEYVRVIRPTVALGSLDPGYSSTNNSRFATRSKQRVAGQANTLRFYITEDAPAKTTIPLTVTITNDSGDSWAVGFDVTVR